MGGPANVVTAGKRVGDPVSQGFRSRPMSRERAVETSDRLAPTCADSSLRRELVAAVDDWEIIPPSSGPVLDRFFGKVSRKAREGAWSFL